MANDQQGRTELERVLGDMMRPPRKLRRGGLGDFDSSNNNVYGQGPGLTQAGQAGSSSVQTGKLDRAYGNLAAGIDLKKCPPWMTPECLELLSRMIEETFRNFQLHARRPSHIDPPFTAKPIDAVPAGTVAIVAGVFTTIATFTVPQGKNRAEIVAAGQSAEAAAAFADITWRIRVDTVPYAPWNAVLIQLWDMIPPTPLCAPIHLRGGQTVDIQAAGIAGPHTVMARLCGWQYPTRVESGDDIRSTVVD